MKAEFGSASMAMRAYKWAFKSKFYIQHQHDAMDCGAACLVMIAAHYGRYYSQSVIQNLCQTTRIGVSMQTISRAAESIGFRTIGGKFTFDLLLKKRPFPCILHWRQSHFVVLYKVSSSFFSKQKYLFHVADPAFGLVTFTLKEMQESWISIQENDGEKGVALLFEPNHSFQGGVSNGDSKGHKGVDLLLSYFKRYRGYLGQLGLGLLMGSLIQLTFPFLTQAIVDQGVGSRDLAFIYVILLAQTMLIFSRTAVEFVRNWLLLHISVRINLSLISDFLVKLMRLPMSYFDSKRMGDILQRMSDHERVEHFITSRSPETIFSFITLLIFSIVLLRYNIPIFLVFLVGSLLYGGWITLFLRKRKELDYRFFNVKSRNQSTTYQLVSGMQEIKLQGCSNRKRWEWEDLQADMLELHTLALKLEQRREAGNVLINESKNLAITVMAATSVVEGSMTLGMMLATQYIIGQLSVPIEKSVRFILDAQEAKISLERINEIHQEKNEVNEEHLIPPDFDGGSIEFRNLSFQYDGFRSSKVLNNISFTIPQGKVTAIVGCSGSGKTTLLKLLLRYYEPIEGEIFIGEYNLSLLDPEWWRLQCGAVMQDGYIFSDSIARNIAIDDNDIDLDRLYYSSKIANIYDTIMSLPLKFNTLIGAEGQGLSQGQKQRLLIARSVYRRPQYLLFDEATNALDSNNERAIVENLRHYYRGKTVVVIAHRLSTVRDADQIIVMDEGRIIEMGVHESLINLQGKYYQLVKNQLEMGN